MIRKLTLVFLLCISFQTIVKAQLDSVSIYLPYGADTTCPGTQLTFTAIESNSSYSTTVTYHWYTDNIITGVIVDTFYTTALVDGDSVYCKIFYINAGFLDSFQSNTIIIHRSDTIPPRVHIALTAGSNPDCAGHPLTFTAYPVNGGPTPLYYWLINSALIPGADSVTFTRVFSAGDTVSCQMISNSACSAPNNDTVISTGIPVIHDSLTAGISIVVNKNPICLGYNDSFAATVTNTGTATATLSWYVDSVLIPAALGNTYLTDSLHNGVLVYCILTAPDECVINHTTVSNVITMTVITPLNNSVNVSLTEGANPGCLDSPVTYTATFADFGTSPSYIWYVNGQPVDSNELSIDSIFANSDILTFQVRATDSGCYVHDTITYPNILMIRDSTPEMPWISLIGNMLVVTTGGTGTYSWYGPPTGSLIPGATGPTYHPGLLGTYYAISDTLNCRSDTSNFIYVSLLDVNDINTPDVRIFPNPTSGIINMDWGAQAVNMKIDVYNIQGQGLLHQEVNNESHHETDISYLPEGNYLVVLRDENGNKRTYKILLAK